MNDASKNGRPVRRVKRGWMSLKIMQIIEETPDTKTFIFVDEQEGGCAFDYIGGQYLTFRYDTVSTRPVVRSYTMSSAPCDGDFAAVTVKRVEEGLVSNWMCDELKVGDVLRARGPIGKFVFDPKIDHENLVFTAGGSGVTPFLSIMKQHAATMGQPGSPQTMSLLVSFRTENDIICAKELEYLGAQKGVRVQVTLTREAADDSRVWHGRINSDLLDRFCESAADSSLMKTTFFSCGPEAIMNLTSQYLQNRGVPPDHIKLESFESN